MSTWTQRDEEVFQDLQARRTEVMNARRQAVADIVEHRDAPYWRETESDAVISWLIDNADAIRDALQPFDSGVRPA